MAHYEPLTNFSVKKVIKRERHRLEKGTLIFPIDHAEVPLLVMDSMGQGFIRRPYMLFVLWHGGKIAQLKEWVYQQVPRLQQYVPLPIRLIFMCGGNDITAGCLKPLDSPKSFTEDLLDHLRALDDWCTNKGVTLTMASVLPRPAEQDNRKSQNGAETRRFLSEVFILVNAYIEQRNERKDVAQLPVNLHLERRRGTPRGNRNTREGGYCERFYPGTRQNRMILNCFWDDWVHLSKNGTKAVWNMILRYMDQIKVPQ